MRKQDSVIDDIRQFCVTFGLPSLILVLCFILLMTGRDGEVKTIMTLAAGWIFKSGFTEVKPRIKVTKREPL